MLTDAGRSYVDSCRRIMEEIAEVERTASGEYRAPQGELIITAPAVLGRSHVLPVVAEFQRAFPDIRVRLQLMDRYVNLVEEHVDVAVRIGDLKEYRQCIAAAHRQHRVSNIFQAFGCDIPALHGSEFDLKERVDIGYRGRTHPQAGRRR